MASHYAKRKELLARGEVAAEWAAQLGLHPLDGVSTAQRAYGEVRRREGLLYAVKSNHPTRPYRVLVWLADVKHLLAATHAREILNEGGSVADLGVRLPTRPELELPDPCSDADEVAAVQAHRAAVGRWEEAADQVAATHSDLMVEAAALRQAWQARLRAAPKSPPEPDPAADNALEAESEGLARVGHRWHPVPDDLMVDRETCYLQGDRQRGLSTQRWAPAWAVEIAHGPGTVAERRAAIVSMREALTGVDRGLKGGR